MKEASGELSMTAITVVAIAALSVLLVQVIIPAIKNNINARLNCANVTRCDNCTGESKCTCYYCADDDCTTENKVVCPTNN